MRYSSAASLNCALAELPSYQGFLSGALILSHRVIRPVEESVQSQSVDHKSCLANRSNSRQSNFTYFTVLDYPYGFSIVGS
jgi:hypothetical protein